MELIKILDKNQIYYGGNQAWFKSKQKQAVGCGIISCTNTLVHMLTSKKDVSLSRYMAFAEKMGKKYFPVIPHFGINGIFLAVGMNVAMKRLGIKGYARWGCLPGNIDKNIDKMLKKGKPVTLSIGPNFPRILSHKKLNLYVKDGDHFVPSCVVNAHYVSVTENLDTWYKISSWGRCYYINKAEYMDYAKHYSSFLVTNILVVSTKDK